MRLIKKKEKIFDDVLRNFNYINGRLAFEGEKSKVQFGHLHKADYDEIHFTLGIRMIVNKVITVFYDQTAPYNRTKKEIYYQIEEGINGQTEKET